MYTLDGQEGLFWPLREYNLKKQKEPYWLSRVYTLNSQEESLLAIESVHSCRWIGMRVPLFHWDYLNNQEGLSQPLSTLDSQEVLSWFSRVYSQWTGGKPPQHWECILSTARRKPPGCQGQLPCPQKVWPIDCQPLWGFYVYYYHCTWVSDSHSYCRNGRSNSQFRGPLDDSQRWESELPFWGVN